MTSPKDTKTSKSPGKKRRPTKASRKKEKKNLSSTESNVVDKSEAPSDVQLKLKQKLREKQLERTSKSIRNIRMDKLEDRLEQSKNPTERRKLKEELALLEKIQEKEFNSFAGEFPDYGDGASYGGSLEHPE